MRLGEYSAEEYHNREMQIQGVLIFLWLTCCIVAVRAIDGPPIVEGEYFQRIFR